MNITRRVGGILKDNYGRRINYLRISVTDFCNLRCKYCMPEEGVEKKDHDKILSVEEIVSIAEAFISSGIDKVRLTGGEPLVRNGILEIVEGIGKIKGLRDFAMTTNGILLGEYAEKLRELGLDRVNISLDTLDSEKYKKITGGGDIEKVFESIEECKRVGLEPIKLNVVVMKGFNDDELGDFIELTRDENIDVRFIELMPIGEAINYKTSYISNKDIIKNYSDLIKVDSEDKSSPAEYYKLEGGRGRVGFINPISCKFCHECNRLRLTSEGRIKPCLHSSKEYDVREYFDDELLVRIKEIIDKKPNSHKLEDGEYISKKMYEIGG